MASVSSKGGSTTNLQQHSIKLHYPLLFSQIFSNNKCKRSESATTSTGTTESEDENCDSPAENPLKISKLVTDVGLPPIKKQKTMFDFQPLDGNTSKKCTEAIAHFIIGTLQPYKVVESDEFKNMVRVLNPCYKIPGRKHFAKTAIPQLYNKTVEKIKKEISLIQVNDIAMTTDCWTSVANVPYIAVTVHFIDKQWNLQTYCLSCTLFQEDHTSENIAEVLTDILSDWNLDAKKISACTTDNGSNITKAISLLNVPHVPCLGHSINIGINKALKINVVNKAVARIKKLQNTIAHSWKMARDFKEAQEFLQTGVVSLRSACVTRWWSTLKLCRRFLENQLPLRKLLQNYPEKKHLMLDNNEIKSVEELLSFPESIRRNYKKSFWRKLYYSVISSTTLTKNKRILTRK